jgi:hypothetical protein
MSLLHDVLSFLAKCRGADVYQATVQAFGQAFASKHSLRRDVSTAMIYNPKDRSIPLLAFASKGRLAEDIVSQYLQDG